MPAFPNRGCALERVANNFEMPESVSNPIDRGAVLEKRLDPFRRGEDRHRIEENRGRA